MRKTDRNTRKLRIHNKLVGKTSRDRIARKNGLFRKEKLIAPLRNYFRRRKFELILLCIENQFCHLKTVHAFLEKISE